MKDADLEWLLCAMPALMGASSGHGALVAALERGPGGSAGDESAWQAVERARPHAQRARRLMAIWATLEHQPRRILVAHYAGPACRTPGVDAQLGELAAVALLLSTDRQRLEAACSHASAARNALAIRVARSSAQRAIDGAHRAWVGARREAMLSWVSA